MQVRTWLIVLLLLPAAGAHYVGEPFELSLVVWFFAALAIGLVLPRWWVSGFALFPWLVGVGLGLATGRYRELSDGWQATVLISVVIGLTGMGLGALIQQLGRNTSR